MNKITMDKKYEYANGKPARILCVDRVGDYSTLSMAEDGLVIPHDSFGKSSICYPHYYTLVEKWEPKVDEWVFFYNSVNVKGLRLAQYQGLNANYMHKDMQGNTFDSVLPYHHALPKVLKHL